MEGYYLSTYSSNNGGSNNKSPVIINRIKKTAKKVTIKSRGARGACCFKRIK